MVLGSKILWGVVALVLLNTFMSEIVSWIVGSMDLSLKFFKYDLSGFIKGAIAGILNAILLLIIYSPGRGDSGEDKK